MSLYLFLLFIFIAFIYFLRKVELLIREEFKNQRRENNELYQYNYRYMNNSLKDIKETYGQSIIDFQSSIKNNIQLYIDHNSKKLNSFYEKNQKIFDSIEKNINEIRDSLNENFQASLNFHLEKSFKLIGGQLLSLQNGLGEMQVLVKDVSSLKRTLNHVKICGSFSEMQLSMLLEQILSPEQYSSNVITKSNTNFVVEFAIRLPGVGDKNIWLPIDVKFPKETYERLQEAYYQGEKKSIEIAIKNMESVLKKMSKDIKEKYIDPPNTTDFAILFLPFEGIYAEITRHSSLLEELLRKYKTVIAGPSTLAAVLNSLQIGFRTLTIQKKTSEIWKVLESVKQEFQKFGVLLHQVQDKLQGASRDIETLLGVRTQLIYKKFRDIEKN
ncbi:DNA recombination protein RmuC [Blattabacterium cuenoti]|uniref:DNA recombination protein RmuC n=1 Tax=Blattabacterium cuenoti TaxID=1653831 RepID=UPI00163CADB5|nr:DNA recombination protein RmuC [Blattabacterium cuenoti]